MKLITQNDAVNAILKIYKAQQLPGYKEVIRTAAKAVREIPAYCETKKTAWYRMYFSGVHIQSVICDNCGGNITWPIKNPYNGCPYCMAIWQEPKPAKKGAEDGSDM